jgi:hypothetical protein
MLADPQRRQSLRPLKMLDIGLPHRDTREDDAGPFSKHLAFFRRKRRATGHASNYSRHTCAGSDVRPVSGMRMARRVYPTFRHVSTDIPPHFFDITTSRHDDNMPSPLGLQREVSLTQRVPSFKAEEIQSSTSELVSLDAAPRPHDPTSSPPCQNVGAPVHTWAKRVVCLRSLE